MHSVIFTVFASLHRGFHRSAQLIYISTLLSFCQALFSFLFKMFEVLDRRVLCFFCFSRSSLHIILHHIPFVNTFFQLFSSFFAFVKNTQSRYYFSRFGYRCIQLQRGNSERTPNDRHRSFGVPFHVPKASRIRYNPGRFRFITVQMPMPASPYSFTRSNLYCQLRTSSNHTT